VNLVACAGYFVWIWELFNKPVLTFSAVLFHSLSLSLPLALALSLSHMPKYPTVSYSAQDNPLVQWPWRFKTLCLPKRWEEKILLYRLIPKADSNRLKYSHESLWSGITNNIIVKRMHGDTLWKNAVSETPSLSPPIALSKTPVIRFTFNSCFNLAFLS